MGLVEGGRLRGVGAKRSCQLGYTGVNGEVAGHLRLPLPQAPVVRLVGSSCARGAQEAVRAVIVDKTRGVVDQRVRLEA